MGAAEARAELERLRAGGKLALSRALSRLEAEEGSAALAALLDLAVATGAGHALGLTGPPGVGKSTLTNALIRSFRAAGETVGVLAVDPSSRLTGGALLGDRTRLATDPEDQGIFVRSMAARDRLGGLSDHAIAAIALMRAARQQVIVESVGIGQSEADVAFAVDTLVLCIQPGSGDSLQFMKAGVMELPDIIVVTKADMGAAAARAKSDVEGALSLSRLSASGWKVPVLTVSAVEDTGTGELMQAIAAHRAWLASSGQGAGRRARQQTDWVSDYVLTRYGRAGASRIDVAGELAAAGGPFAAMARIRADLDRRLGLL
ncbi:methylmalonyl Co-A mutase-associated GTPase MeaB [Pannonibacter tanglangensis]|uniref:methylmalonyl Co-A mutase-associated GTPase MeaB n=1 Tax=Pannonibacter tanglangensis TaxID=2750084 RepID=UPI0032983397